MKISQLIFPVVVFCLICLPLTANAVLVGTGDIVRVDFDLSAETPDPPYEGIYTSMAFGSDDYLNVGEGFSIGVFDDGGEGLNDGIGYFLVYDIVGTFDLTNAWAAGRFYLGSTVIDTTEDIEGSISLLTDLPDLGNSLAALFTFENTDFENISWFGHDRILLPQAVPEPSTILLIGLGLAGLGFGRRKKIA